VGGLSSLLVCPGCRAQLGASESSPGEPNLRCPSCAREFPRLGQIPVLAADPSSLLAKFRSRLRKLTLETDAIERHLLAELVRPGLPRATTSRLRAVSSAMPEHRKRVLELFADVGLHPAERGDADEGSLLDFVTLIHRDYAWQPEVDEVTPALTRLLSVLPADFRLGRTLVLGAGTARLAWDLALHFPQQAGPEDAEPVLALDLNPLPLLVTQRLLAGREVELYELPGHPRHPEHAAVRRTLRAPGPPPPNLKLLLADGLEPPVARGVWDTVITPWFLDQVPPDLATFLPILHELLAPGGAWLHTGPFVYEPSRTMPAHRYGVDELLELAHRAGFEVTRSKYEPADYLCSPLSTQGRREWVLNLHAVKANAPASAHEPAWLGDGAFPIPPLVLAPSTSLPLPILERVLALIDGERSAKDITARLLDEDLLADDGNAEVVVQSCLRLLWKATR